MKTARAFLIAVLFTGACKVGPDYEKPAPLPGEEPLPDHWHTAATMGLDSGEADLQTWWTTLADPKLHRSVLFEARGGRGAIGEVLHRPAVLFRQSLRLRDGLFLDSGGSEPVSDGE